jgi:DNA-binding beta-propeller fold protein YncE
VRSHNETRASQNAQRRTDRSLLVRSLVAALTIQLGLLLSTVAVAITQECVTLPVAVPAQAQSHESNPRICRPAKVYWTDVSTTSPITHVSVVSGDGSSPNTLITQSPGTGIGHVAIDDAAGKMYWADAQSIRRANLDGTSVEVLAAAEFPVGIALDTAAGKVYWSSPNSYIRRANLDGTAVEDVLVLQGLPFPLFFSPQALSVDAVGAKIYWTNGGSVDEQGHHAIQRANLDGTGIETLILVSPSGPAGIALDVPAETLYWTEIGVVDPQGIPRGSIHRAKLDGTDPRELIRLQSWPLEVDLDATQGKIYWVTCGCAFAADGTVLPNKIQRADLTGGNVEDLLEVTSATQPVGIALGP